MLMMLLYTVGGKHNTIKRFTYALVIASKGIGMDVISDKAKYMVIYREQMQDKITI